MDIECQVSIQWPWVCWYDYTQTAYQHSKVDYSIIKHTVRRQFDKDSVSYWLSKPVGGAMLPGRHVINNYCKKQGNADFLWAAGSTFFHQSMDVAPTHLQAERRNGSSVGCWPGRPSDCSDSPWFGSGSGWTPPPPEVGAELWLRHASLTDYCLWRS